MAMEMLGVGCSFPTMRRGAGQKEGPHQQSSAMTLEKRLYCSSGWSRVVCTCVCWHVHMQGSVCPSAVNMTEPTTKRMRLCWGIRERGGMGRAQCTALRAKGINAGPGEEEMGFIFPESSSVCSIQLVFSLNQSGNSSGSEPSSAGITLLFPLPGITFLCCPMFQSLECWCFICLI